MASSSSPFSPPPSRSAFPSFSSDQLRVYTPAATSRSPITRPRNGAAGPVSSIVAIALLSASLVVPTLAESLLPSFASSFPVPAPLPAEIAPAVPACALACLASFASANYPNSACGTSPTLPCLCAHLGLDGLTLGEAAVECIVAENRIGYCDDADATKSVITAAHYLCADQPGAVLPTRTQLIATFVMPTTGSRVLSFPTPSLTSVTVPTLSPSSPHPVLSTSRTSVSSPTSSFQTTTASSITSTPGLVSRPTSSVSSAPSNRPSLAQLLGLILGVVVSIVTCLVIVVCIRCRKRRRAKRLVKNSETPEDNRFHRAGSTTAAKSSRFHLSPVSAQPMREDFSTFFTSRRTGTGAGSGLKAIPPPVPPSPTAFYHSPPSPPSPSPLLSSPLSLHPLGSAEYGSDKIGGGRWPLAPIGVAVTHERRNLPISGRRLHSVSRRPLPRLSPPQLVEEAGSPTPSDPTSPSRTYGIFPRVASPSRSIAVAADSAYSVGSPSQYSPQPLSSLVNSRSFTTGRQVHPSLSLTALSSSSPPYRPAAQFSDINSGLSPISTHPRSLAPAPTDRYSVQLATTYGPGYPRASPAPRPNRQRAPSVSTVSSTSSVGSPSIDLGEPGDDISHDVFATSPISTATVASVWRPAIAADRPVNPISNRRPPWAWNIHAGPAACLDRSDAAETGAPIRREQQKQQQQQIIGTAWSNQAAGESGTAKSIVHSQSSIYSHPMFTRRSSGDFLPEPPTLVPHLVADVAHVGPTGYRDHSALSSDRFYHDEEVGQAEAASITPMPESPLGDTTIAMTNALSTDKARRRPPPPIAVSGDNSALSPSPPSELSPSGQPSPTLGVCVPLPSGQGRQFPLVSATTVTDSWFVASPWRPHRPPGSQQ